MPGSVRSVYLYMLEPLYANSQGIVRMHFPASPVEAYGYETLVSCPGLTCPTTVKMLFALAAPASGYLVAGFGNARHRDVIERSDEHKDDPSCFLHGQEVDHESRWGIWSSNVVHRAWGEHLETCSFGPFDLSVYGCDFPSSTTIGHVLVIYRIMWVPEATTVVPLYKVVSSIASGVADFTESICYPSWTVEIAELVATKIIPALDTAAIWLHLQAEIDALIKLSERFVTFPLFELLFENVGGLELVTNDEGIPMYRFKELESPVVTNDNYNPEAPITFVEDFGFANSDEEESQEGDIDFDAPSSVVYAMQGLGNLALFDRFRSGEHEVDDGEETDKGSPDLCHICGMRWDDCGHYDSLDAATIQGDDQADYMPDNLL